MSKDRVSNLAASVRQRLLNIIRETGTDANLVWSRYATERLLYRLSVSEHAGDLLSAQPAAASRATSAVTR